MGQRYGFTFKDFTNNSYEVKIHQQGYEGDVTELTGAKSCFVVEGTDEDFIYTPIRVSTATIKIIGNDLLLDLYSINNQYAPVELYKNGVLEWCGYIKPEQFTQPYVPTLQTVSVECISPISTLENIEYTKVSELGFITAWELLKNLIAKTASNFNAVYIPWVYVSGDENKLETMELPEENFTAEEMNMYEVLEELCKFFGWTLFDVKGNLFFVDSDWNGVYREYDASLTEYTEITRDEISIQDIGYNGSSSNMLDVVPGYNKATVKSVNNTFDEAVVNEDYDELEKISDAFEVDGINYHYRRFLKPNKWKVFSYDSNKELITGILGSPEKTYLGAVLMKEAIWEGKWVDGVATPNVKEYPWTDCIQMRYRDADNNIIFGEDEYPTEVLRVEGPSAVWSNGAISISGQICYRNENTYLPSGTTSTRPIDMLFKVRIGDYAWTGEEWVEDRDRNFDLQFVTDTAIAFEEFRGVEETKEPTLPYSGLNGYIIPLPDTPIKGDLQISLFIANKALPPVDILSIPTMMVIKDLNFGYAKKEGINNEGENGDRIYENVVNENYMSECDEIEFNIGSYNNDGATYSKALLDGDWLTNNLPCRIVSSNVRPEELMIRRIVNRYNEVKVKLTQSVKMADITPISILSDSTMVNKRFIMTSGEWDYEQNRLVVQMQEDV